MTNGFRLQKDNHTTSFLSHNIILLLFSMLSTFIFGALAGLSAVEKDARGYIKKKIISIRVGGTLMTPKE